MRAHLLLIGLLLGSGGAALALPPDADEAAGRRLYQDGLSSSGGEVLALVGAAGTPLPAASLPCAGCHGSDGRGRPEGSVRPPDITWRRLSKPYTQTVNGRTYPAYDEAALARAIEKGVDPAGNRLDPAMPRFVLSAGDMARLIAYLRGLETRQEPGVSAERLRIGTLLPGAGALAEQSRTVAALLQGMVAMVNQNGGIHGRQLELVVRDPGSAHASAEQALRQLLDDDQVFALLAPLAPQLEGRLDELARGVPVIGPLAQFADGDQGRAIFAPLPGLREQMLALASFAARLLPATPRRVVLAYQGEARLAALAEQLSAELLRRGWSETSVLAATDASLGERAERAEALFYLGSQEGFVAMSRRLPAGDESPPYLFAAASQVAGGALEVPSPYAERLLLAYPFLRDDWTRDGAEALARLHRQAGLDGRHGVLQVNAYCAALLLFEGLSKVGRDASRQGLVSALEGLHGFRTGLTPVLGFGPGRRVGANGVHVVAVDVAASRFRPLGYVRAVAP